MSVTASDWWRAASPHLGGARGRGPKPWDCKQGWWAEPARGTAPACCSGGRRRNAAPSLLLLARCSKRDAVGAASSLAALQGCSSASLGAGVLQGSVWLKRCRGVKVQQNLVQILEIQVGPKADCCCWGSLKVLGWRKSIKVLSCIRQSLAVAPVLAAAAVKATVPALPAGTVQQKCLLSSSFQVVTLLLYYVLAQWQSRANNYRFRTNLSVEESFPCQASEGKLSQVTQRCRESSSCPEGGRALPATIIHTAPRAVWPATPTRGQALLTATVLIFCLYICYLSKVLFAWFAWFIYF